MISPTFALLVTLGCFAALLVGGDHMQGALALEAGKVERSWHGHDARLYREHFIGTGNLANTTTSARSQHPPGPTTSSSSSWSSLTWTSLKTIYTIAAPGNNNNNNSATPGVSIWLYNLTAFVDKDTRRAQYNFEFVIDPDTNAMLCNASVGAAASGALGDVHKADCWQNHAWLLQHNYTVPVHFSFAWRMAGLIGTNHTSYSHCQPSGRACAAVLVLRSTNPARAHHCPNFPHDACWAQGLYWVDPAALVWCDGVQVYAGDSVVRVNGTYCRSGMPECAWSEYIY